MTDAPGDHDAVEASPAEIKAAGIAVGYEDTGEDQPAHIEAIKYDLLRKARGLYDRAIDERWVKVNVHGQMACPVCGAVVADNSGKRLHRNWHHGEAPSLVPILRELEQVAELIRGVVDEA